MGNEQTVVWEHIILDPAIYARHNTYRVARIPGGLSAFMHRRRGMSTYRSDLAWQPSTTVAGLPPAGRTPADFYRIASDGRFLLPGEPDPDPATTRVFRFAFWSYRAVSGSRGRVSDRIPSLTNVVEATAYFVWDFGNGPGDHFVYLDAFDESSGMFIADDFVNVAPDQSPAFPRTGLANNGILPTGDIPPTVVTAYESIFLLDFVKWEPLDPPFRDLSPIAVGRDLYVEKNHVANTIAFYKSERGLPEPTMHPYGWQHILSGQAGGPVLVLGGLFPTGDRGPRGPEPGDTYRLHIDALGRQLADLGSRVHQLEAMLKKQ